MKFPAVAYPDIADFMADYGREHHAAFGKVDREAVAAAAKLFDATYRNHHTVFVCGNGGSAAIANHMVCDHGKLIGTDTKLRVRVQSLCSSNELMTAISNDLSFEDVFAFPLRAMAQPGDVLLTISGSGESPNVLKAQQTAREMGLSTVAFTGFDGGKSARRADINVHVPCQNYGIVEDIHQAIMQIIAQFIRMSHMDSALIATRKF